jgi:hypothetical protein
MLAAKRNQHQTADDWNRQQGARLITQGKTIIKETVKRCIYRNPQKDWCQQAHSRGPATLSIGFISSF